MSDDVYRQDDKWKSFEELKEKVKTHFASAESVESEEWAGLCTLAFIGWQEVEKMNYCQTFNIMNSSDDEDDYEEDEDEE